MTSTSPASTLLPPVRRILLVILLVGLIVRLWFLWSGATFYYGNNGRENGDSYSYEQAFINWWKTGQYTFDPTNADASFGRLPGYPLLFGVHYLIAGPTHAADALAFTQAAFDTLDIYLIFAIALALFRRHDAALFSAGLHAVNPFVIVWIPVIGTELVATFITLLFFYVLLTRSSSWKRSVWLGAIAAVAFYIRPYLGILVVPLMLDILIRQGFTSLAIRQGFIAAIVFVLIYGLWPLRNYVNYQRVVLLTPPTSGYDRYSEDILAAREWIYGWSTDADFYLQEIAQGKGVQRFPENIFADSLERREANLLMQRAALCGKGFRTWALKSKDTVLCTTEIAKGFDFLRKQYKSHEAVSYYVKVPTENLLKFFFKSSRASAQKERTVVRLLFFYRTLLLLSAIVGIVWYWRRHFTPPAFFIGFMVLFICVMIRQLEMRYLLQAEVVLFIFCGIVFANLARIIPGVSRK